MFELDIKMGIKNQGSKPTCVAHALSSLIEYHNINAGNSKRVYSTQFIYGYRPDGYYQEDGMRIKDALNTILKWGDPYKTDCPGNSNVEAAKKQVESNIDNYKELAYSHRITCYYKCKNADEIKTALINHGPVVISMNTYNNSKIVNDIYTWDPNENHGRHCVLIIGWNKDGWIIQNSWGTSYAGDGKFILPFDFKLNEAWGVSDFIDEEIIKKPNRFMVFLSSLVNKVVNLFRALNRNK
jgi:C1A family cysteine protease